MADKKRQAPEAVPVIRKGIRMTVSEDDLEHYLKRGYERDDSREERDSEPQQTTPVKVAPTKAAPKL